jgi:hypothetical protein
MTRPEKLRIPCEPDPDDRFYCIGIDRQGNQFMGFVTGAFPKGQKYPDPSGDWRSIKRWYAVMHHFDPDGNHLSSEAWSGGTTADGQMLAVDRACAKLSEMFESLDGARQEDIWIKPFCYEQDGYLFGLIYEGERFEEEGPEREWVILEPNDVMFHPLWNSGEYST